ncbi:DUF7322 domain-containing protein [Salinigranum rubrum]|uniref:DUF7322 domain-containing protein n=1 Tax=Salinigranum rubrum TaxID=755307 RepID=UPI001C200025|nr:hypothetical protein [Salinigranum rubrum]
MFEPWPDEPDEPNAESRWGNPERDLPRIPEVSTDESDVDPHTFKTFWVSVVFTNVAVFGVSLGAMLWYFRGQALLGGVLCLAGVLAGIRTYASYRAFKSTDSEETADDGADGDTRDGADGDDSGTDAPADTAAEETTETGDGLADGDEPAPDTDERNG